MASKDQLPLAFIFACAGKFQQVEGMIESTLQSLETASNLLDAEIIIGFDDANWQHFPMVQTIENRFPAGRLKTFFSNRPDNMAVVFNQGVKSTEAKYVSFIYPGCLPVVENLQEILHLLQREEFDWLARADDKYTKALGISHQQLLEKFLGYFLSIDTLFPLCQAVVRRDEFISKGGFSENLLLKRDFDTEFWLRSAHRGDKISLLSMDLCKNSWTLQNFPYKNELNLPRYLINSYKLRRSRSSSENETLRLFLPDLADADLEFITQLQGNEPASPPPSGGGQKYKLAITGGIWEYVHNKLCFYNPLRALEGKGEFIYFPVFDFDADSYHNLLGVDCVIISRGRHENVLKILEYCKNDHIPVIYMIDDNWFSVGKDYPNPYASIFSPGLPAYEVFLTCIRESDAVLVYNPILEEDVKKHAKRLIRLDVNISLDDFDPSKNMQGLYHKKIEELNQWQQETGGLIIGYAGSTRYTDNAFMALNRVKQRFPQKVRLLLFGMLTPSQINLFDDSDAIFSYVSYETYGSIIAQIKPDILLAPLESSRTSQSKCPNKYLEYSAIGAAGVYSNLHPYSDVVSNGNTGVLVDDTDIESWERAIVDLMNDSDKRKAIAGNAYADIKKKYETGVIASSFASAVRSVILDRGARL